jgi:Sigma-54 interaction domain
MKMKPSILTKISCTFELFPQNQLFVRNDTIEPVRWLGHTSTEIQDARDRLRAASLELKRITLAPSYYVQIFHDLLRLKALPKHLRIDSVYHALPGAPLVAYDVLRARDEEGNYRPITPCLYKFLDEPDRGNPTLTGLLADLLKDSQLKPRWLLPSDEIKEIGEKAGLTVPDWLERAGRLTVYVIVTRYQRLHNDRDLGNFSLFQDDSSLKGADLEHSLPRYLIAADVETHLYRHFIGEYCRAVPIPPFPEPGILPAHCLVLAARVDGEYRLHSDLRQQLSKVGDMVRRRGKRIVFIQGEPGSGKEVYATALHQGTVGTSGKRLEVRSVANMDTSELRRALYGEMTSGGLEAKGMIATAKDGTVFLDEFDKLAQTARGFYGELLRVLEAEQYFPIGKSSFNVVENVSWIFAGAFQSGDALEAIPRDFWSRLNDRLKVGNPVREAWINGDGVNPPGYVAALFVFFFSIECVKRLEGGVSGVFERKRDAHSEVILRMFTERFGNQPVEPPGWLRNLGSGLESNIQSGRYYRPGGQVERVDPPMTWPEAERILDVLDARYWFETESEAREWAELERKRLSDQKVFVHFKAPDEVFDSVRSIRQAAQKSFDQLWESAMGCSEAAWLETVEARSEEVCRVGAEAVKALRPGSPHRASPGSPHRARK